MGLVAGVPTSLSFPLCLRLKSLSQDLFIINWPPITPTVLFLNIFILCSKVVGLQARILYRRIRIRFQHFAKEFGPGSRFPKLRMPYLFRNMKSVTFVHGISFFFYLLENLCDNVKWDNEKHFSFYKLNLRFNSLIRIHHPVPVRNYRYLKKKLTRRQCCGSVTFWCGSGSSKFFAYYFLKVQLHNFSKIKSPKEAS